VRKEGSALALLLEEEIAELLRAGVALEVRLWGPRGSGKTTALRHLAALFADEPRLVLLEDGEVAEPSATSAPLVVVRATRDPAAAVDALGVVALRLAPWSDDELLEYALERHRDRASVLLEKLRREGWPAVMCADLATACLVLDRMAEHPEVDLAAALQRVINTDLPAELRAELEASAYRDVAQRANARTADVAHGSLLEIAESHAALAALGILAALESPPTTPVFPVRNWSAKLVDALRAQLVGEEELANATWSTKELSAERRALLLSLLCIARPQLRIEGLGDLPLSFAHLNDALLGDLGPQLRLDHCSLQNVHLVGRRIARVTFEDCDLRRSDWSSARVSDSRFVRVALEGAKFAHADLDGVTWQELSIDGRIFSGAKLIAASFIEVAFAGVAIPDWSAEMTHFARCDLTRARLPRARLHRARFTACRMHGIELPGADLSCADLRGAQFHFGNARSGLVGSPLASEGTRTGFYTDEHREYRFRSPEAVRVADFTGCDLRGAQLEGADFYLVDFRGAQLDPVQRIYLQRCHAILD
jgi:uncharacterized protein YjbI with pentapeptide repeats/energy-coupling factor transporter ATP-binding protein EcfA2